LNFDKALEGELKSILEEVQDDLLNSLLIYEQLLGKVRLAFKLKCYAFFQGTHIEHIHKLKNRVFEVNPFQVLPELAILDLKEVKQVID
jgi:hypothetical protein